MRNFLSILLLKIRLLLKMIIISLGIFLIIFTIIGAGFVNQLLNETPIETQIEKIKQKDSYVPIEQISQTFLDAIVAIEDKNFYDHHGINIKSIMRAIKTNIEKKEFAEGGSTITQQLAKNMYLSQEKTIMRKVQEMLITGQLERAYSKEEILEIYVNVIYYGKNAYGIAEATNKFYGKTPLEIDFNEATWLAGMPQAPSIYSQTENASRGKERQRQVVNALVEFDSSYKQGKIELELIDLQ